MKKTLFTIGMIIGALVFGGTLVYGEATNNNWTLSGGNLKPNVSSWGLQVSALASAGNPCVIVNSSGVLATTTCAGGGISFTYPFTTATNYGVTTSATNTPIWAQAGLMASSTSYFSNASSTLLTATNAWITSLANLTSNGFVKTSGSNGTLSIDTNTYLTGNQTITLSGAVTGSGTTAITTSYSGTVPIANGGTNTTSQNTNGVNYFNGTSITSNSSLVSFTGSNFGIGTTTPYAPLSVVGQIVGSNFTATTTTTNTFPVISSTNITTTNATSTGKLNIPNGSSPSVAITGDIAIDTTSDQLIGFGGSAKKVYGNGNLYGSFTYATSTAAVGTTTIPLGVARVSEIWNDVTCFTDTGTWQVSFNDGTNRMNFMNASTTSNINTISTNATIFTAGTKRYVDIGTPLSNPTKVSCTVSKSIVAD